VRRVPRKAAVGVHPARRGYEMDMATDIEIDRALAAVSATLNDHKLEQFDRRRVQEIVTGALAGEHELEVDDGGGVHEPGGERIGAIRRLPDGSWHVERQNFRAHNAAVPIPAPSKVSAVRKLLTKMKVKV
jgi:hypothetical protein